MHHQLSTEELFAGTGAVARLMRSCDWSQTSLGAIATWPPSLKTTLGILFNASTPMLCVWGSDRWVFYNDACAVALPESHSILAAGQPLNPSQCEAWEEIARAVEAVFATGQSARVETALEGTTPETTPQGPTSPADFAYTWACSAIWETSGQVGGVFASGTKVRVSPSPAGIDQRLAPHDAQFCDLADASPTVIWISGPDGGGTWFNRRWRELTGQPLEAALGQGWLSQLHPDDRQWVEHQRFQAHQLQIPLHLEYRLRRQDGIYRWVLDLAAPWFNDSDRYQGHISYLLDISDLKQAEVDLRESESLKQSILDSSNDCIKVLNLEGQILFMNQGGLSLLEVTDPTSVLHRNWVDFWHGEDHEQASAVLAVARAGRVGHMQGYCPSTTGVPKWWDVVATPLRGESGQVIRLVVISRDITEQKQAEAALRESEERFRNLADNISQFAWMAEADGWIFWYNRRWFDYTGTTLEDMQGWGWQEVHHPDHLERVVKKVSHCFATGQVWEDTFPLRSKDGQYRWFLSRAIPLRDDQGQVVRWFGTNTDVTELRQTEIALKRVTERLNTALRSAPITLFNQDRDLRYTWIYNPTYDHSMDEVIGQRDEDLVSGEAAAHLRSLKQQVLDTGLGLRQEVKIESTYYDLTIDPIENSQNVIVGITCAAVDISQRTKLEEKRKQAEETLLRSEDRLRMAVESARIGIWDWNLLTNELIWDPACKAMFGLSPEADVTIEVFFEGLHPEDRDRVEQILQRSMNPSGNSSYDVDYRTIGIEDGIERWISAKGQVYFHDDKIPYRFTGTALNITDRKRFEQVLMESEAIAVARAEELAVLMETTPAAIWIAHDPQCQEMTANQMAHQLMQTEPGATMTVTSINGGSPPLLFRQTQNDQELLPQHLPLQKAISTRQEVTEEIEFTFPDGTVRHIYGRAVPLYDPTGDVRGAIAGFAEITALKESERARELLLQRERLAREEAEQANRLKDEFLAVLSHELRSPLNPILGWSRLLQTHHLSAEKTAQALAVIERNARLQAQLVDDLLDLARVLRGKLHLDQKPVSLAFVIKAALDTVKTAAANKAITLRLDLDNEIQVIGDAARLQQIVWNLLSNAIKFTPEQGQVSIRLRRANHQAQMTVTDTGIGISSDFLPCIFESFRQEDISITRQHGGLGLGLAIVRCLVEAHDGTIIADSPGEGEGASFTVHLPLATSGEPLPPPESALSKWELDLAGVRILTVDDSPDTRDLLMVLLKQHGAEVITASSAAEALSLLQTTQPDVLISDIGMPEIDGYTLIQQIRALPAELGGQTPAIALTAYAREDERQRALDSGYQHHLAKPMGIETLVKTVVTLVQSQPALCMDSV